MIALLVTASSLFACVDSDTAIPESLLKAIDRRMAFQTAYFEYSHEAVFSGRHDPKHRYEARFAGRDIYWTEFGGEDGAVHRDPRSGEPTLGVLHAFSPARTVRCNDGKDEWSISDGSVIVSARPTPSRFRIGGRAPQKFLDPRSAGLDPTVCSETSPRDILEEVKAGELSWSEERVEEFIEVTASTRKAGDSTARYALKVWRIDPRKDDSIVEIRFYAVDADGSRELTKQMVSTLQKVDGHWWPRRCETRFASGGVESIEFTKVEFDRPEHPSALGPDFLGIPEGLNAVDRIHYDPQNGPLKIGRYVGAGKVVPVQEWDQNFAAKVDPAPLNAFKAKARALGPGLFPRWWSAEDATLGLAGVEHEPDQWESYVRRWIMRHSWTATRRRAPNAPGLPAQNASELLSEAQVAAAWAILKDCRNQAAPIVARMAKAPAAPTPAGTEHINRPTQNRSELEKIFGSLRVRLSGLLTKKQESTEKSVSQK